MVGLGYQVVGSYVFGVCDPNKNRFHSIKLKLEVSSGEWFRVNIDD